MSGELILYTAEDRNAYIELRAERGSVWLTKAEIATLFDAMPQNITQHTKAIFAEGELTEAATCKQLLQVRQESGRAEDKLDAFLRFDEREVLSHAGKLHSEVAETLVLERYESFDTARREAARLATDAKDMEAEKAERLLKSKGRGKMK